MNLSDHKYRLRHNFSRDEIMCESFTEVMNEAMRCEADRIRDLMSVYPDQSHLLVFMLDVLDEHGRYRKWRSVDNLTFDEFFIVSVLVAGYPNPAFDKIDWERVGFMSPFEYDGRTFTIEKEVNVFWRNK